MTMLYTNMGSPLAVVGLFVDLMLSGGRRVGQRGSPRIPSLSIPALQVDRLDAHRRDTYVRVGPSGAGKSNLSTLLNSLEAPTTGYVRLQGEELSAALCCRGDGGYRDQQAGVVETQWPPRFREPFWMAMS
jgi:hypothetical protein